LEDVNPVEEYLTDQNPMDDADGNPAENADQDMVLALAASPDFAQDGLCFAARRSGLYRSADGGESFEFAYDSLNLQTELPTLAVAFSPSFAHDHTVFAAAEGGIVRSFDAGETWQAELFPNPPPMISALLTSPNYEVDGTVFAGTMEDGVYRSGDRGGRWELWNFRLLDLHVLCMAISSGYQADETLFAGTETGVFRSTNGARAWREMAFPTECAPVISIAVSPDYPHDNTVYAGTEEAGLWRSADRGASWEQVGKDVVEGTINAVLAASPLDLLVLTEDAMLVSHDGGASWTDCEGTDALEEGATCVAAPQGLAAGAPLLVGLADGQVVVLAAA
jgi:photosystem II stability/assembly factor-like uncharacterized protein